MAEACAAETCQHTCAAPDRRPHAWTLRYSVNGKQKEESFRDDMDDGTITHRNDDLALLDRSDEPPPN
jgi:hypothetical protein